MSLRKPDLISPSQYLAEELASTIKREYLGGVCYAMSGARIRHNRITTSLLTALGSRLRGRPCEPFNSDTKVRIQLPTHVRFYYPDAMVVCQSNPEGSSFQDSPSVVVEVLSRRTRRIDEGEKKDAYLTIPSLVAYLLVEQESPDVVVFRRGEQGFLRQTYEGLEAAIPLPEIGIELSLEEIYERVQFGPEDDEDELEG